MDKHESASRTLSNKSNIWLVGMKAMDARVIKNYLYLVKDLNEQFTLIGDDQSQDADIIFVNVDSIEACDQFKRFTRSATTKPVLVKCSTNKIAQERDDCLFQPITRSGLEGLLKNITSTQRVHKTTKPIHQDHKNELRVLVVDDSFPVRKYMEEKLPGLIAGISSEINLTLDFASSGKDASALIKKMKGEYDVVFLDVVMEDIDGYKICKWIKSAKASIEVIMLTSKNSTFDKVRGKIAGCNSYLAKPPSDSELQNVLRNTIQNKFLEQQDKSIQHKTGNAK